ncbi:lytic murein transglycosylase [Micromonospora cathayae]
MRTRPLRPAVPPDGPLASSGAAPEPASRAGAGRLVPRPRHPVPTDAIRPGGPQPAGSDPPPATPTDADPPSAGPTGAGPTPAGVAAAGAKTDSPTTADDAKTGPDTATADAAKADDDKTKVDDTKVDDTKTKVDVPATDISGDATKDAAPTDTPGDAGKDAGPADTSGDAGSTGKVGRAGRRRYRVPFAHAVRLPPPRQAAAGAVRATRAWSKRPSGRVALPGLLLLGLVSATAAAGALLVPGAARDPRPVAEEASASAPAGPTVAATLPGGVVLPPGATPLPGQPTPGGVVAPVPTGRPADALADWARTTGAKVGIDPVAMQAYGYAELVLAQTTPGCALSWTTIAAIGYVESRHGRANGATLLPDGRALPEIIGDPLDGNGGRMRIMDTDRGLLDRDTTYDRAVGPMQFIPTTWKEIGADADNDGVENPHDLDDAALAAGNYLCKGGRNMTVPGDWWGAILSYNDVRRYAQDVFDKANEYGVASRP